jgi:hypothetical protein
MAYAERTRVPFPKTVSDIMTMLRKAGAVQVGQMEEESRLTIIFGLAERQIRFRVTWENTPSSQMQRARALLLVIKAKLESVESGVETFEQSFLANIVMSDGRTVHERVNGDLALEYKSGQPTMYLLGGAQG